MIWTIESWVPRHVILVDPSHLSERLSNADRLGADPGRDWEAEVEDLLHAPAEESVEPDPVGFEAIEPYLFRIPSREQDFVRLYWRDGIRQEAIASIFGVTQAAVSYRLGRARKRLQFLQTIPVLSEDVLHAELELQFCRDDREIMWQMYVTTSQSTVAAILGFTQGKVRHRYFTCVRKLKLLIARKARELDREADIMERQSFPAEAVLRVRLSAEASIAASSYAKYWTCFSAIADKRWNILHEVTIHTFARVSDAVIIVID